MVKTPPGVHMFNKRLPSKKTSSVDCGPSDKFRYLCHAKNPGDDDDDDDDDDNG